MAEHFSNLVRSHESGNNTMIICINQAERHQNIYDYDSDTSSPSATLHYSTIDESVSTLQYSAILLGLDSYYMGIGGVASVCLGLLFLVWPLQKVNAPTVKESIYMKRLQRNINKSIENHALIRVKKGNVDKKEQKRLAKMIELMEKLRQKDWRADSEKKKRKEKDKRKEQKKIARERARKARDESRTKEQSLLFSDAADHIGEGKKKESINQSHSKSGPLHDVDVTISLKKQTYKLESEEGQNSSPSHVMAFMPLLAHIDTSTESWTDEYDEVIRSSDELYMTEKDTRIRSDISLKDTGRRESHETHGRGRTYSDTQLSPHTLSSDQVYSSSFLDDSDTGQLFSKLSISSGSSQQSSSLTPRGKHSKKSKTKVRSYSSSLSSMSSLPQTVSSFVSVSSSAEKVKKSQRGHQHQQDHDMDKGEEDTEDTEQREWEKKMRKKVERDMKKFESMQRGNDCLECIGIKQVKKRVKNTIRVTDDGFLMSNRGIFEGNIVYFLRLFQLKTKEERVAKAMKERQREQEKLVLKKKLQKQREIQAQHKLDLKIVREEEKKMRKKVERDMKKFESMQRGNDCLECIGIKQVKKRVKNTIRVTDDGFLMSNRGIFEGNIVYFLRLFQLKTKEERVAKAMKERQREQEKLVLKKKLQKQREIQAQHKLDLKIVREEEKKKEKEEKRRQKEEYRQQHPSWFALRRIKKEEELLKIQEEEEERRRKRELAEEARIKEEKDREKQSLLQKGDVAAGGIVIDETDVWDRAEEQRKVVMDFDTDFMFE
ncbi:hypothetical protein ADUPG1_014264 [Aduncisulcus paluster]|uniref:Uncharacterized protein n=1 Tax=Aduncisulcus paluster TaxID=2918883 RepID=A0ABQ5KBF7_9EUKA|nr:hypothetical protein ADUPG1_014264 [Aduncisulcus paluster]